MIATLLWLASAAASVCRATPPAYQSFGREQQASFEPQANRLLRIWVVFVDQGDGILIQLPPAYRTENQPTEIVVDGGPQGRMTRFLQQLYPGQKPTIEFTVITHHDQDHVGGITHLLNSQSCRFGTIYHNGLASYLPDTSRGFHDDLSAKEAVVSKVDGHVKRGMAFLDTTGAILRDDDLIHHLDELVTRAEEGEFEGVYQDLAQAVSQLPGHHRAKSFAFPRASLGESFIEPPSADPASGAVPKLTIDLLWPPAELHRYHGWSETINGNSVTFQLNYGEFRMLFSGDHNEHSEEAMVKWYQDQPQTFACDVFKVPHHGSAHASESFFQNAGLRPVVSVASMGNRGFRPSWKHPSPDVIRWLGGAHRVYHTFVHERRFEIADLSDTDQRKALIEKTHILIETDGEWFRVVEVDADDGDLHEPPTVQETRRGNGTQWISASE